MTGDSAVAVMRGHIGSAIALRDIADNAAGLPVVLERSVLYPYAWFSACCSVPTIGGTKAITVDCLVDGINGHGMTADAFSTDALSARGETTLQPVIEFDDARRIAQRTVTHGFGRKLKMIASFDVHLEERGTVYKRFWIVRIGAGRIMIDAVTGRRHPLQATAA